LSFSTEKQVAEIGKNTEIIGVISDLVMLVTFFCPVLFKSSTCLAYSGKGRLVIF